MALEEKATKNKIYKEKQSKDDYITWLRWGVSELVATALLIFMGCMGCVQIPGMMPIPHYVPALSFGLVIALLIQGFGHISGAHLNPAVSIAAVLLGIMKPIVAVVYIAAQFIGALLGFGLLKVLIPADFTSNESFNPITNLTEHTTGVCTTIKHPQVTSIQAVTLEIIFTAVVIIVCCAVWDKRNVHNSDSLPLRFGLIITAIGMVSGPYSGISLNTPRSFAPAVFNNDWESHWIYWVGPQIGAFIGVYFYKAVFALKESEENKEVEGIPLNEKFINNEVANNV